MNSRQPSSPCHPKALLLLLALCTMTAQSAPPARTAAADACVRVSPRDHRYLALSDGAPWLAIGFNLVPPPKPGEFEPLLDRMAANGINFCRVWLGHPDWEVEHARFGEFDEERGRTIARFLALARERGIRVKLCLEYFRTISAQPTAQRGSFPRVLYHRDNGGAFGSMKEYLEGDAGRAHFRTKLDWFAAHVGGGPAVFAWELWNEMNAVQGAWQPWTREMLPELKRRFPKNLAVQSLGSFDRDSGREAYRALCALEQNDVLQVHRYLDLGAALDVCHGPADVFLADAVRELAATSVKKPILVAETGAVKPSHTGCSDLYAKDPEGMLMHDMIFAPFFCGAAGTGHGWFWRESIERPNLWHLFARFAEAVRGIDPPAEAFRHCLVPSDRLRVYALAGKKTFIAWCRDAQNDWRSELEQGKPPETLQGLPLCLAGIEGAPADGPVRFYDPWKNAWSDGRLQGGTVTLPPLRRSLVLRIVR